MRSGLGEIEMRRIGWLDMHCVLGNAVFAVVDNRACGIGWLRESTIWEQGVWRVTPASLANTPSLENLMK